MARSRTSVVPGNGLAVVHGAKSPTIVTAEMPKAVTEIMGAIEESVPFLQGPDHLLVEQAARLLTQIRLIQGSYDRRRSLLDRQGRAPRSWPFYVSLQHQWRETVKLLGISPVARAQLLESMAGAQNQGLAGQLAARQLERARESHISPPKEVA